MTEIPQFVAIARLLRPQGRRGELLAEILTDFPEKFSERTRVFLAAEDGSRHEYEIEDRWMHKGSIVLKFAGIDSISDAEKLAKMLVEIPLEQRATLEEGAVYTSDLVGCVLVDLNGAGRIGAIDDVRFGAGAAPLLVVGQHEIPFASEFLVRYAPGERLIEMKLPAGLLEVNAPLSDEEKREMHDQ
jgi:16S rRNA processing protein RimM